MSPSSTTTSDLHPFAEYASGPALFCYNAPASAFQICSDAVNNCAANLSLGNAQRFPVSALRSTLAYENASEDDDEAIPRTHSTSTDRDVSMDGASFPHASSSKTSPDHFSRSASESPSPSSSRRSLGSPSSFSAVSAIFDVDDGLRIGYESPCTPFGDADPPPALYACSQPSYVDPDLYGPGTSGVMTPFQCDEDELCLSAALLGAKFFPGQIYLGSEPYVDPNHYGPGMPGVMTPCSHWSAGDQEYATADGGHQHGRSGHVLRGRDEDETPPLWSMQSSGESARRTAAWVSGVRVDHVVSDGSEQQLRDCLRSLSSNVHGPSAEISFGHRRV